ncbi:inorganic phosphate transporter [Terriglobus aquaticus]|uniref:Anion permease n=1 Tax=Terriglobus aquaticus TaxID=940139 RepID=A0ABW9KJ44_9BACT|nr:inorganic phosphate transporter [Terriglobus aquaticus]
MHAIPLALVVLVVAIALLFDFLNGVHDAANSVATIVTTRVLTPTQAVAWAAFFNFVAAFVFGTGVAHTISNNLIDPAVMSVYIVLAGLLGAVVWNVLTWYLALPTSSSHAIISSLAGAALVKAGSHAILLRGWAPVLLFLVISPLIGMVLGYVFMHIVAWSTYRIPRERASKLFRSLQLFSAGAYSLGHGTNDAQKTMGIIVALLVSSGYSRYATSRHVLFGMHHEISLWIILSCHAAIALGTMIGGWRIVKTMGSRITPHLRPMGGFSAELAAAFTIGLATFAKVPISTTHAIGGAISGVGATRGVHAVRWVWARRIVYGWVLTFPGAALIGGLFYLLLHVTLEPLVGVAAR